MQISGHGPIPFNAARAYGRPAAPAARSTAPANAASTAVADAIARPADRLSLRGATGPAAPASASAPAASASPATASGRAVSGSAPASRREPPAASAAGRLVAGRVPGRVQFENAAAPTTTTPGRDAAPSTASSAPAALPFHARAADRFEAGLGVARGRVLDLRG